MESQKWILIVEYESVTLSLKRPRRTRVLRTLTGTKVFIGESILLTRQSCSNISVTRIQFVKVNLSDNSAAETAY